MINVMVLYPNNPGTKFDMSYYLDKHIPMVAKLLSPALQKVIVEQGVSGAQPGTSPAYVAICHLHFDSVATFGAAFGPHATTIMQDIPNYTSVQPVIQINELKSG
jgi:uncharacterized protein (TIGR02118 family)